MKKFIVSSLVIVSFTGYCLYKRASDLKLQAIPVIAPKTTTSDTPTIAPSATAVPGGATAKSSFKDGTYRGIAADAFYGMIQVKATIVNGKLTDVTFLQAPSDRGTSVEINTQADPQLAQEAIAAQSAMVDIVSGATDSSQAFMQSLQSALNKAKS